MTQRPLPTPWNICNLTRSPFFQQPLEAGEQTPRPLRLFIGRAAELHRLRGTIHGAGEDGTVQALAGAPGVGKTTLVKELKALALDDGYLTTDDYVAILPDDSPGDRSGACSGRSTTPSWLTARWQPTTQRWPTPRSWCARPG